MERETAVEQSDRERNAVRWKPTVLILMVAVLIVGGGGGLLYGSRGTSAPPFLKISPTVAADGSAAARRVARAFDQQLDERVAAFGPLTVDRVIGARCGKRPGFLVNVLCMRIDDEQIELRVTVRESPSGEDIWTRAWSCPSSAQAIDPMIASAANDVALVLEDRIALASK